MTNEGYDLPEAPEGWSKTDAEDGYKYNSKIKVNGDMVQPVAVIVQRYGEYQAEIYFSGRNAETYSDNIGSDGIPTHYAQELMSWDDATARAKLYAEKHNSAYEIRESVNAPKEYE